MSLKSHLKTLYKNDFNELEVDHRTPVWPIKTPSFWLRQGSSHVWDLFQVYQSQGSCVLALGSEPPTPDSEPATAYLCDRRLSASLCCISVFPSVKWNSDGT